MQHPVFGQKITGADYQSRYGVYAIIPDATETELVLIQAPNGAWFLPGGEIETDENHHEALSRELLEELGATASIGAFLGQADEYFYSRHRDTHFYHPAYLYVVSDFKEVQQPLEDFNRIGWFPIAEAKTKLKRDSHRWGIDRWLEQKDN
ncbi:NUDIX hydrolase [Streptococcus ovuberis]|uniref:NUDIX hydrolase n=1 Tax=Streptococcus ovuberis TaxID=1936207 RepID=A0A7X6MXT2_9STRE|nr:NUDIX hydrolase [Streptococcus ovuberis]NKZ20335.1 NUDIX hydrolase [Streptococcus ovuberis]